MNYRICVGAKFNRQSEESGMFKPKYRIICNDRRFYTIEEKSFYTLFLWKEVLVKHTKLNEYKKKVKFKDPLLTGIGFDIECRTVFQTINETELAIDFLKQGLNKEKKGTVFGIY